MEERKIFDKKFVHCMWDTELEGKRCIVSDSIDTMIDAVDNGTYHTAVINRSKGGGYALHSNETGSDYIVAYYDPLYNIKWAWKQGQKVEVYGFVGISRAWIEVTEAWKEVPEALKWNENYQYRIKSEKFMLIEPDCNNDKLQLLLEGTPVHVDEHAFVGTREECRNYAVKHFCDRCIHTDSPCVWDDCTGFVPRWRPFKDIAELKQAWNIKRSPLMYPELDEPMIWVRDKKRPDITRLITNFNGGSKCVAIAGQWHILEALFDDYEFLDGTPCGVEEK